MNLVKILITLFVLLVTVSLALAQKTKRVSPKPKAVAAKSIREKFDPKRDPAKDLLIAIMNARTADKRIILDVGGEWCGWCIDLDNYFIKNPALSAMRDRNFVWVKVNWSPENKNEAFLSKYPRIDGFPHLFVLESDGTLLHSQDTVELEEKPPTKGEDKTNKPAIDRYAQPYDLYRVVQFLKEWSPTK